jgi:hypothetical protein
MQVTKSSDLIYSYDTMRAAFEAGYNRFGWEEVSGSNSDSELEPPEFEDFMKKEFNDPMKTRYQFRIREDFDDDYRYFPISAYDIDEAHEELSRYLNGKELKYLTHIEVKILS